MRFIKIILVIFLVFAGSGCIFNKTPTTQTSQPATDITGQDSKTVQSKTLNNLAKAKIEAASWKSDATFVAYNFKFPPDLNPKNLVETFVFGTPTDTDYWWTYTIAASESGVKPVRALLNKDDYLGKDLQPIQEQYWKISYVEALKTAEENGGLTFRSKNPEAEITLTLSQSQPKNWLWYVIEYRGASNNQKVWISANDGKVYDDQGNLQNSSKPSQNQ